MNQFFIKKVQNLQKKLPKNKRDPLKYLKNAMKKRKCSFKFSPVSQDTILKIVKNLKNSKSTGLDDIDTNTIKLVIDEILPDFTHVIIEEPRIPQNLQEVQNNTTVKETQR